MSSPSVNLTCCTIQTEIRRSGQSFRCRDPDLRSLRNCWHCIRCACTHNNHPHTQTHTHSIRTLDQPKLRSGRRSSCTALWWLPWLWRRRGHHTTCRPPVGQTHTYKKHARTHAPFDWRFSVNSVHSRTDARSRENRHDTARHPHLLHTETHKTARTRSGLWTVEQAALLILPTV